MTFGTIVRMLSGVGVVAGLMGAGDNVQYLSTSLHLAGFSFIVFLFAVLIKIESK